MELIGIIGLIGALILGGVLIQNYKRKKRREYLMSKYNDALLADLIMSKKIQQGMTIEQLVDSWGNPIDIDEKVYRTKTKYTYKYNQVGKNRFRERVYVENGSIVGWEERG